MSALPDPKPPGLSGFRLKLLVAMMLLVSAITGLGLYFAQHNLAASVERDRQREFQKELASLLEVQEMRHAALAETCRALVRKPRIHAALEDNALDLLYPSAKDELRDVMSREDKPSPQPAVGALHAVFCRFLDLRGAVIPPPNASDVGELGPEEEAQLALNTVPEAQQIGYLLRKAGAADESVVEVIAMPIISTETQQAIAALVVGFTPVARSSAREEAGIKSGVCLQGRLHVPLLAEPARTALGRELTRAVAIPDHAGSSFTAWVDGAPHLLFYTRLNPGSLFPPAFEVIIYPLADLLARQRQLRRQIVGAGALMLLAGLAASHVFSGRLSGPVEKLAVDSAANRAQRERAEAALELTNEGLQRAIRFSADASHQLKTPLTVLRAGLEELLARENLTAEVRVEIAELVHQTYRLTNVIDDLLLLSRMDAGRLPIEFAPLNLTQLLEALLDDLGTLPDTLDLTVETDFPTALHIVGEKRYSTIIVQNLLENARKYNRPGGRIRVAARADDGRVLLTIGNTGRPIPAAEGERIFERFHRGAMGENIPGHGLGLNLARELARLHGGDLRLAGSDEAWTEFEVRFRLAQPPPTIPV